ncbi:hypothetical protein [Catenuloplanes atrovinosus]|uniref:Cell division protein FtsB n=1 Tax=Catenuloplanes atrovinosus TaxID=137266 RepID=A0AAE3YUJ3_9ACTN|nr:hypothetical protein [Catenuloplanes atrovinosus]MDR7278166.1 hypothetical protein [Catenuloplanes atrovinosus]
MNVNKRDRGDIGAGRETVQRAPRSGGRTAAQWAPAEGSPRSGGQEAIVRGIGAGRRAERLNGARGRGAAAPSTTDLGAADQEGPQRVERLSSLERIERRRRAAETTPDSAGASTPDRPARRARDERPARPARAERDDRAGRRDDRARQRDERAGRDLRAERIERADRASVRGAGGSRTPDRADRDARREPRATAAEPVDLSAARGRRYGTEGSAALEPEEIHVLVEPAEPVHEEPPAPRLRVTPPRPVAVPRAPFIAGILVTVVAGVVGILLINTQTNQNAFRLDELQKQQAALDVQQQELEKQIEEYESPNYLIAHAKKLGLVKAEEPAFIRLPDGKVIGVPMPAGGEPAITSQESGR